MSSNPIPKLNHSTISTDIFLLLLLLLFQIRKSSEKRNKMRQGTSKGTEAIGPQDPKVVYE